MANFDPDDFIRRLRSDPSFGVGPNGAQTVKKPARRQRSVRRSSGSGSNAGAGLNPCGSGQAAYLKGWLNEPYVQEPVIAVLKRAQWPLLLREIADEADVPLRSANRVLGRLLKKGAVTRSKAGIQRHGYCRRRGECIPHAAKRMLFIYRWIGSRG
jgi:hypothetical protein